MGSQSISGFVSADNSAEVLIVVPRLGIIKSLIWERLRRTLSYPLAFR